MYNLRFTIYDLKNADFKLDETQFQKIENKIVDRKL